MHLIKPLLGGCREAEISSWPGGVVSVKLVDLRSAAIEMFWRPLMSASTQAIFHLGLTSSPNWPSMRHIK